LFKVPLGGKLKLNWGNINKILDNFTQQKHYNLFFEKNNLPKKNSRTEMAKVLYESVMDEGLVGPILSKDQFEEWLALHQIDGNNYSFVYNLEEKPENELLQNLYLNRSGLIKQKIWDYDIENYSENLKDVLTNLVGINLIGIHRDEEYGKFIFSFVTPCEVMGTKLDGSTRIYKKMFFSHCVFHDESNDLKIVFNPTSNLLTVNSIKKKSRFDWTPVANMFFTHIMSIIGRHTIKAPNWIPQALYLLAEEATNHNNPEITELSFNAQEKIEKFASELLKDANIDIEIDAALVQRFEQDIQQSFESQLVEKLGVNEDDECFIIFRQRSDGVTHTINVESRQEGFRSGSAAQAAKRSRVDGDLDLLGIIYRKESRSYKFLVERSTDAYLIRGTNTFIEEEVVNDVIRKLNEYRKQIQSTAYHPDQRRKGAPVS
jgi:hypothetical protein